MLVGGGLCLAGKDNGTLWAGLSALLALRAS